MRALIAGLTLFAVDVGCASTERRETTASTTSGEAIVDSLYAEYGGPREPKPPPPPTGTGTSYSEAWAHRRQRMMTEQGEPYGNGERIESAIKSSGHVDNGRLDREKRATEARALFAARCDMIGHGEEPQWGKGDERAKEFFDRLDVRAQCADMVRMKAEEKR